MNSEHNTQNNQLQVFTITDTKTNVSQSALLRWKDSCTKNGIQYTILTKKANDSVPLDTLRDILSENTDTYILFIDYNSSFVLDDSNQIINAYKRISHNDNTKIVYPALNGGRDKISGFMGHSKTLSDVLQKKIDIKSVIRLDNKCRLFQHIANCSAKTDLEVIESGVLNKITNTKPKILCTDNSNRLHFNFLENYTLNDPELNNSKLNVNKEDLPHIDIFAFGPNANSLDFIKSLDIISYPIDLLNIWYFSEYKLIIPQNKYTSKITFVQVDLNTAHSHMIDIVLKSQAEYAWLIYEDYVITHPDILIDCIKTQKHIVAPLFRKFGPNIPTFSNFWGAIKPSGYYDRSSDYIDILNQTTKSVWDVPYIYGNILVKKEIFVNNPKLFSNNDHLGLDIDMQFCHNLRENNELMYVLNAQVYGSINDDDNNQNINNYVTLSNKTKWFPQDYLHPEFYNFMYGSDSKSYPDPRTTPDTIFNQLLPDVWQFPFFSEEFCKALITEADSYGKWSAGNDASYDPRLAGKYEYYPTQDIHLNQINLHTFWSDTVINDFFTRVMSHLYKFKAKGYNIAFIARYKFGEQVKLSPHHDASVYTTNIALNACDVDYEGGGCKFVYLDKSVTHTPVGYVNLHPGRLSHYHEGLPITSGTRYILVSFNE